MTVSFPSCPPNTTPNPEWIILPSHFLILIPMKVSFLFNSWLPMNHFTCPLSSVPQSPQRRFPHLSLYSQVPPRNWRPTLPPSSCPLFSDAHTQTPHLSSNPKVWKILAMPQNLCVPPISLTNSLLPSSACSINHHLCCQSNFSLPPEYFLLAYKHADPL